MRLPSRGLALPWVLGLLLAGAFPAPPVGGTGPISVSILFDLGDGTYLWSDVSIDDPGAHNATWDAVLAAAASHGVPIEWEWFDPWGIAISDIGDRNPPAGFIGLFLWNGTSKAWESALGVSSLVLGEGDVLALYNAAFDSVTPYTSPDYEVRTPIPTPDHPSPSASFRGGSRNLGRSSSEAPNGLGFLWDADLGTPEIGSTPAVAQGRVYVTTLDGLFALDAGTGEVLWVNPDVRGFSSPAVVGDSLVVGGSDGALYRVRASDGAVRWSTTLLASTTFSGITSSPKIDFDWVYVGTFNESGGGGELVSLLLSNGSVAWRYPTGSVHFSSPAVADGTLYVGVMGLYNVSTQVTFDPPHGVLALAARTGEERWFFETSGPVAASPLLAGSRIFVPSKDGAVYAIDAEGGEQVWRAHVGAGVASPATEGDTIFVGGGGFGGSGRVMALDATSGEPRWSFTPNGPVQASLTYADGKVFFATNSEDGTIYALNATSGEVVWSFTPSPQQFILGSPVVANNILYAPSDNGHMYAIRSSTEPLGEFASSAPSHVGPDAEAEVTFVVRAVKGRMEGVAVSVFLPGALKVTATSPAPSLEASNTLEWHLGSIPFGEERNISLRIRPSEVAVHGALETVSATLVYTDNDGTPLGPHTASVSMTALRPMALPAALPLTAVVLAVVLVAVGSLTLLALRRRRWGRGP